MRAKTLVALAAVASHATALAAGFTWLDHGDLERGAALAPPAGWLGLFAHGYARTGFYRPLTALSLSLDALVGSPLMFHATNLVLHAAVAVLVVVAAQSLGLTERAAALAGGLFAVHPVTEGVAGLVVLRGDSLAAGALLAMVAAWRRDRRWLAGLALAVGALSKETALVLGPLCLLALAVEEGRSALTSPRRWAPVAGGWALAAGARLAFAPPWRTSAAPLGALEAVGTRLAVLARAAWTVVLPVDRRLCDAFPVTTPWSPSALAGAVVLVTLVGLAWRRRGPAVLLGLAVLPLLQLVPAPRFWSPHYLYLPLAFVAMLVAEQLDRRGAWAVGVAAVVAAGLSVVTLVDSRRFHDDLALFTPEVQDHPECREAALYLGDAYRERGDFTAAAQNYEAAIAPTPGFLSYSDVGAALQNLGLARLAQGQFFEAELALQQAGELPLDALTRRQVTHDLAAVAVARGDPAEAARLLGPEASRADALPESLLLLARALRDMGREEEARAVLSRLPGGGP